MVNKQHYHFGDVPGFVHSASRPLVSFLRVCGSRVPFSSRESGTAGEGSPGSLLAQSPFLTTHVAFVLTFPETGRVSCLTYRRAQTDVHTNKEILGEWMVNP